MELKDTDKFCNNCGAKNTLDTKRNKPVYKSPKFWIVSIGLFVIVGFIVFMCVVDFKMQKAMDEAIHNHSYSSSSETSEQPATEYQYIKVDKDIQYTLKDMTFTIPQNWEYAEHVDSDWVEIKSPNNGNVQISFENEDLQASMNDVTDLISNLQSAGITVIDTGFEDEIIGGQNGSFILFTETIGNAIIFNDVYIVQFEDNTYTLNFSYCDEEAIGDSAVFIKDILGSVTFH